MKVLFYSAVAAHPKVGPALSDELGALQVGVPTSTDRGDEDVFAGGGSTQHTGWASTSAAARVGSVNAFTLPYRASWSMGELVERFLTGKEGRVTPRRLLLVDRYVYGPEALRMAELLHRTLRERFPQVSLELWTQNGRWINRSPVRKRDCRVPGWAPRASSSLKSRAKMPGLSGRRTQVLRWSAPKSRCW